MKLIQSFAILFLLTFTTGQAQTISKDSINSLNKNKERIDLEKVINSQKLKLADMENSLESKRKTMESDKQKAGDLAKENAETASKLSGEAPNRKVAKQARKTAKRASRAINTAKDSEEKYLGLQRDIENLRKDLADNESKLSSISKSD